MVVGTTCKGTYRLSESLGRTETKSQNPERRLNTLERVTTPYRGFTTSKLGVPVGNCSLYTLSHLFMGSKGLWVILLRLKIRLVIKSLKDHSTLVTRRYMCHKLRGNNREEGERERGEEMKTKDVCEVFIWWTRV